MSDEAFTHCRGAFPALSRTLHGKPLAYFDGPGGTQVPQAVMDAITDYYTLCNANTHGQFVTSRESDRILQETREAVAAFLGAPSWREISFGANMTTLAFSLSRALARDLKPGDEVVITQLDHEANRGPWLTLAERGAVLQGSGPAPRRHPRPRGHGPPDRSPHPPGGHRLFLQRPRHRQRPGPRPPALQGRGRLAAHRRGPRRAPLPPGRGGPGRRLPALLGLQVLRSPRRRPLHPARPAGAAGHGPAPHPGTRGPVPHRDRHPEPRGLGRRAGRGRLPREPFGAAPPCASAWSAP